MQILSEPLSTAIPYCRFEHRNRRAKMATALRRQQRSLLTGSYVTCSGRIPSLRIAWMQHSNSIQQISIAVKWVELGHIGG